MEMEDLQYLCQVIGNLSGMPMRIYEGGRCVYSYSRTPLAVDPIVLAEEELLKLQDRVSYYITKDFYYYGTCTDGNRTLTIGPGRLTELTERELSRLAFRLSVPADRKEAFFQQMRSIVSMPLETVLQVMCSVNFAITREKLSPGDITIVSEEQSSLYRRISNEQMLEGTLIPDDVPEEDYLLNYQVETKIGDFVRRGDLSGLQEWAKKAPAMHPGMPTEDALRRQKDLLIVTATMVSREAIRGGMPVDEAFRTSDAYIRKSEQLTDIGQIMNLMYHIVEYYTREVEALRFETGKSDFLRNVIRYIRHHLSEPIRTEEIAAALFMSRSRLSTKFHEEMGIPLKDYIRSMKISEAKHLLQHRDKSILSISTYLGFTSQSHFCRVFRAETGMTPGEYRAKCTRNTGATAR